MRKMLISTIKKIIGLNAPLTVGTRNEQTRVEWIKNSLEKIPAGSRILDAGAGEQPFRKFCTHLDYVCQDFDEYDPSKNESGLQRPTWDYGDLDIISDIASIPEANQSFDAIMCTEVFEHIINPREALVEFARLLKPGGYLLLTSPFASLTHFAPYHFYSGFNRFFYEQALSDNGFKIIEVQGNGNYFEFVAQEINRINSVAHHYTNSKMTMREIVAAKIILKALERFSKKDSGSDELLNFGFHVRAQKY
jgi:2-polyprenyl-3-methyl-5-hydroxy-6-metoxy-1,4-benzoquinol methylase